MKKILFICPYPLGRAPSQRFRFEQYMDQLRATGVSTIHDPFLTDKTYTLLFQSGNFLSKISAITESIFRRIQLLFRISDYDFVFIHRETLPVGPPIAEWLIARVMKKKVIFDYDDAVWLTDKADENRWLRWLRWRHKTAALCSWSYRVSCGNSYLAEYARQYNRSVIINPTTIDTEGLHRSSARRTALSTVTIGWTGSRTTLKYLHLVIPVLQNLEERYANVEFLIIADQDPQLPLQRLVFRRWSKSSEASDLAEIDIGIMPLPDDPWTRGKCGFKALQYMAMEIPAVVSAVGVNTEIVRDGVDGFLCATPAEWKAKLETLILDAGRRETMGKSGRQRVIEHYSVAANKANFLSLFE